MSEAAQRQSDGLIVPLTTMVGAPTPQQMASDPGVSVWVGASAGSGKTKALADRVIRLLLSGVLPHKILCLTFTRAAAAEMSIRITQQLKNWAVCPEDALGASIGALQGFAAQEAQKKTARRLFTAVLHCPGGMRIRTLHAFAQEILRRFPLEAGIPPHFMVMEDDEARALWREALDSVLREASATPDSAFGKALTELVRERQESGVTAVLREATADPLKLDMAVAKAGSVEQLIEGMRRTLGFGGESETDAELLAEYDDANIPAAALRQAARKILDTSTVMFQKQASAILRWLALPLAKRAADFDSYKKAFLTQKNEVRKKLVSDALARSDPAIKDMLEKEASRILSLLERLDSAETAARTAAVVRLAVAINDRYAALKAAQGVMDYGDLIRKTEALLQRPSIAPWILYKLDGGIDHILVDEAQDTSPQQWKIVKALTEEFFAGTGARDTVARTLFAVGDEKQSIFSFQGADLASYAAMREYFGAHIREAEKPYSEVELNVSFRSAPKILDAVDTVFAANDAWHGVAHEAVRHVAYWGDVQGRVEVWPLQVGVEAEASDASWVLPVGYEAVDDPAAALAAMIAQQIKEWCAAGSPVHDRKTGHSRAMTPGDVMVLVQRRGAFVGQLVRALKNLDVPVTGVDRMQLTQQLAVMDLIALLQFTLLPEDDLTLATVLRGPLLGCSEEQLMRLAIGREGPLWQRLGALADDDAGFGAMYDYLRGWLGEADIVTPFAMLAAVLSQPCPGDAASGRRAFWKRLGPDAQDPIDELLSAAQNFGVRHTPSLQAFLCWLAGSEAEIKRELDQGFGQVRISTVHAAKGLQAPVVILPDTAAIPSETKLPKILWDDGVPFYVPRAPLGQQLRNLRDSARALQLAEYRRLLYVALTRAADRLYICGWQNKAPKNANGPGPGGEASWYDLVSRALAPLHQPGVVHTGGVQPMIAMADGIFQPEKKQAAATLPKAELPAWIGHAPAVEAAVLRRMAPAGFASGEPPFASPIAAANDKNRFARGRLIHRLLQSLPDVAMERQAEVTARFLANPQHGLDKAAQREIGDEVLALIQNPAYAPLFWPGSRAEVPLIGYAENVEIPGQVDRLCVLEDSVWVVDFKTNRPPPADISGVPAIYLRQMGAYRTVLRQIYPDKSVRCFLLWTYAPLLMELGEEFLPAP